MSKGLRLINRILNTPRRPAATAEERCEMAESIIRGETEIGGLFRVDCGCRTHENEIAFIVFEARDPREIWP